MKKMKMSEVSQIAKNFKNVQALRVHEPQFNQPWLDQSSAAKQTFLATLNTCRNGNPHKQQWFDIVQQALRVPQNYRSPNAVNCDWINQVQPKKHFLRHHTPVKMATPTSNTDFVKYNNLNVESRLVFLNTVLKNVLQNI